MLNLVLILISIFSILISILLFFFFIIIFFYLHIFILKVSGTFLNAYNIVTFLGNLLIE